MKGGGLPSPGVGCRPLTERVGQVQTLRIVFPRQCDILSENGAVQKIFCHILLFIRLIGLPVAHCSIFLLTSEHCLQL